MVGLTAGLASRILFEAASTGGQIAGNSMGFGFGALLDPSSGAQSSALGELYTALALGAAIAIGLHQEAISWLVRSVQQVPPGGVVDVPSLCRALVTQSVLSLALVTRVAWPIFAVTLLVYTVLGLIGRTAPQLQLGNLGFAGAILSGGTAFYLTAPAAAQLCARAAAELFGGA
jgi:flagellar biosynthetic protein FliR